MRPAPGQTGASDVSAQIVLAERRPLPLGGAMNSREATAALLDTPSRTFAVELWDGTPLPATPRAPQSRLVLRCQRAAAWLTPPVSEQMLANAFVRGDVDIAGDTIAVVEALARWEGPRRPRLRHLPALAAAEAQKLAVVVSHLDRSRKTARGRLHSRARDGESVRSHYDTRIELFRLFLDPSMTYSCAYFTREDEPLESAQRNKLELVARKLDLTRGDRFLDVGCGWGSLVRLARERGADALGITVSDGQLAYAGREQLPVERRDYRDMPRGPFDKIASVGMMEHVGGKRLREYLETIYDRLRPGGLFLNHAIADITPARPVVGWAGPRGRGFIERDVFPDTELLPLGRVVQTAEACGFEVRDVESLREHYVLTLARWLENLERRFDDAARIVGVEEARRWRLYLASCAVAFRLGRISVYQTLLARRDAHGAVKRAARQRPAWYAHLRGS